MLAARRASWTCTPFTSSATKPPPTIMHLAAVRQQLEIPFDHAGDAIRLGGTQAEPIAITGTGGSIPELAEDLRGETAPCALRHQPPKRPFNNRAEPGLYAKTPPFPGRCFRAD